MRFEIHPEPSADETAAIVTAIKMLKSRERVEQSVQRSGWQVAARREALHAELQAGPGGWRLAARLDR